MAVTTEKYVNTLQEINSALTKGLQMAIAVLENPDRFTEEQRTFIIEKMKELVKGSQIANGPEPTIH